MREPAPRTIGTKVDRDQRKRRAKRNTARSALPLVGTKIRADQRKEQRKAQNGTKCVTVDSPLSTHWSPSPIPGRLPPLPRRRPPTLLSFLEDVRDGVEPKGFSFAGWAGRRVRRRVCNHAITGAAAHEGRARRTHSGRGGHGNRRESRGARRGHRRARLRV